MCRLLSRCSGNQECSAELDKTSGLQSESKRASHEELNSSDAGGAIKETHGMQTDEDNDFLWGAVERSGRHLF